MNLIIGSQPEALAICSHPLVHDACNFLHFCLSGDDVDVQSFRFITIFSGVCLVSIL